MSLDMAPGAGSQGLVLAEPIGRCRDIFPLPPPFVPDVPRASLSRGTRMRMMKARASLQRAKDGVDALNEIAGSSTSSTALSATVRRGSLEAVETLVKEFKTFEFDTTVSAEEAVHALLGTMPSPYGDEVTQTPASFREHLVALPHCTSVPTRVEDMLDADARGLIENSNTEIMRRDAESAFDAAGGAVF